MNRPTEPSKWTDPELIAELKSQTPLNEARRVFSSWCAKIEQAGQQRRTISPIDMRKMEFEAVLKIIEQMGYNPDQNRKCLVRDCPNHNDAGVFIGDLCAPCYETLIGGGHESKASQDRIHTSIGWVYKVDFSLFG